MPYTLNQICPFDSNYRVGLLRPFRNCIVETGSNHIVTLRLLINLIYGLTNEILVLIAYAQNTPLNANANVAGCLNFAKALHLHLIIVYTSSERSESVLPGADPGFLERGLI